MSKLKVFVADSIAKEGIEEFKRFKDIELEVKTGLPPDQLAAALGDSVGLVVRSATKATKEIIAGGKSLRVIGRAGAGVDNIDVPAATEKGILVLNTPGGNAEGAGELAIALMFALARQIPQANASMKAGTWDKKSFSGTELFGKTLGLVGIGNVGSIVGKRAVGIGMKVVAYDPYADKAKAASLGFTMAALDEVLAKADFISVHTPKTDETKGMINAKAFEKMKTGVYVVNCARGGIVVEKDLIAALDSGKVKAAGVDVYDKEPPEDWALAKHAKVIATPHIGASTAEAQITVSVMIAQQMGKFLTTGEIINAVNKIR
jgi:D-3-phosphoglycerate dehydrogenase / 2-oxoglutarate reductase